MPSFGSISYEGELDLACTLNLSALHLHLFENQPTSRAFRGCSNTVRHKSKNKKPRATGLLLYQRSFVILCCFFLGHETMDITSISNQYQYPINLKIHIAPNCPQLQRHPLRRHRPGWSRTTAQNATASAGKPKKVDDDPDGEKLLPGTPRVRHVM